MAGAGAWVIPGEVDCETIDSCNPVVDS